MPNKVTQLRKQFTKNTPNAAIIQLYLDIFEDAYTQSIDDLTRLEDLQNMYDNQVDTTIWPTVSKISIPQLFMMVERALPSAMDYMFPTSKFLRLNPMELGIDMEQVRKAEWGLQHTVTHRMKLQYNSYATVKDCFKLGVGYGIVESITITPPAAFTNQLMREGRVIASARSMGMGTPKKTVRFKYVGPGQIIVTRDGNDFNGNHRVSTAFYLDVYPESVFRDRIKDAPTDGENLALLGDVEEIIKQSRALQFDSSAPILNLVAILGGYDVKASHAAENENLPVLVPVLKCYSEREHVWIANGLTLILKQNDKYQTMRCPLVKCSAHPDGTRWYPMNSAEAGSKLATSSSVWASAIFDLMTRALKPVFIYDKAKTGNKPPERTPNSDIGVTGDVSSAAAYIPHPPADPALFTVGDLLQRWYGGAVGQEDFLRKADAGLMRGGMFAFESLLQQSTGRERLSGAILETSYVESAIQQALIYMQLNMGPEGDVFRLRNWDAVTGEEYVDDLTVTENDLVNAYELELDLKAKHRNSMMDQQARLSEYSAFKNDEYLDQYELRIRTIADENEARRLVLPRERVLAIQEENRRLSVRERELGIEQAGTMAGAPSQRQQALAGAGAATAGAGGM